MHLPATQMTSALFGAKPDWWAIGPNLAMAIGTLALVIIGVFAARAAFRTLDTIKEQTEAAKDSAETARLNAQAVIDSERPWLVVTVEKNEAMSGYFFFRITNRGGTPAKIISAGFSHDFQASPDGLPMPPVYEPFFAPNNRYLLAPGDYFNVQRTWNDLVTGFSPETIITSQTQKRGTLEIDILFFYGQVIYDDVFGTERPGYAPHETRWCFSFHRDGMRERFVRTGPNGDNNEYNRHT
jgi:hypothetical protein